MLIADVHFRVKGTQFTVPALLGVSPDSEQAQVFDGASLASFRCAMLHPSSISS